MVIGGIILLLEFIPVLTFCLGEHRLFLFLFYWLFCRYKAIQNVHYGTWQDINDLAVNLLNGFNADSAPEDHNTVLEAIQAAGIAPLSAEVSRVPENTVRIEGKQAGSVIRMLGKLEEQDDVQNVFSNFDIDEEELEALSA